MVNRVLKNKWIKRAVVVVALAAAVYGGYGMLPQEEAVSAEGASVQEYTLKKESITETLSTSGTVQSETVEKLLGDVSSPVTHIHVAIGDQVSAGEVLAEMNPIDVESDILNQEVVIASLKQEIKALSNDKGSSKTLAYENAKVAMENAKSAYESNQLLYDNGAVSQTDLEKSLESYNTAKSTYENAKRALESYDYATEYSILEKKLKVENTKLESLQQDLLDHQIVASIDGVVTAIDIEEGEVPKESSVMMEIQDLSNLKIEASISEYEINDIKVGQAVSITSLGNEDKVYQGLVERIYPSGQVEGSEVYVTVLIDVVDEDEKLKPNFSANLEILTASKEDALLVPYDALIKTPKGYGIQVKTDDPENPEFIRVETGVESDLTVEVISEKLHEGMIVLVESEVVVTNTRNQNQNGLPILGMDGPGSGGPGKRMN